MARNKSRREVSAARDRPELSLADCSEVSALSDDNGNGVVVTAENGGTGDEGPDNATGDEANGADNESGTGPGDGDEGRRHRRIRDRRRH